MFKIFMVITPIESELGGDNRYQSSIDNISGLASCWVWEAGMGHCGESSKHLRKFRAGTLNVNTLRGRVCEAVETLSYRKVDVCCIQETIYRGGNCCTIKGKVTRYKLCWSGNDSHCWFRSICGQRKDRGSFLRCRVSDRIILVKLLVNQPEVTILCVNAPQSGLVMRLRTCSLINWVL